MLVAMDRPGSTGPPLVVTADADLLAELMRLCAAASVTPVVVSDAARARADWWRASCVLVGSDLADGVAGLGSGRRDDVVLVTARPESADLWRHGVAIHAEHVVVLPDGERWLVDRLADSVDERRPRALTLGIVGGCGGAGASTLAAALSLRAAREGHDVLLIDADPLGGGIELVLGCEAASGLRWPEVAATQGRVRATALREALPEAEGIAVLSWDRAEVTDVEPSTMRAMVTAGQRGADLVVVDLPRRFDDAVVEAVALSDTVLLVCTGDVRAAASAERQLQRLRVLCGDIRLVVRRSHRWRCGCRRLRRQRRSATGGSGSQPTRDQPRGQRRSRAAGSRSIRWAM